MTSYVKIEMEYPALWPTYCQICGALDVYTHYQHGICDATTGEVLCLCEACVETLMGECDARS